MSKLLAKKVPALAGVTVTVSGTKSVARNVIRPASTSALSSNNDSVPPVTKPNAPSTATSPLTTAIASSTAPVPMVAAWTRKLSDPRLPPELRNTTRLPPSVWLMPLLAPVPPVPPVAIAVPVMSPALSVPRWAGIERRSVTTTAIPPVPPTVALPPLPLPSPRPPLPPVALALSATVPTSTNDPRTSRTDAPATAFPPLPPSPMPVPLPALPPSPPVALESAVMLP